MSKYFSDDTALPTVFKTHVRFPPFARVDTERGASATDLLGVPLQNCPDCRRG